MSVVHMETYLTETFRETVIPALATAATYEEERAFTHEESREYERFRARRDPGWVTDLARWLTSWRRSYRLRLELEYEELLGPLPAEWADCERGFRTL